MSDPLKNPDPNEMQCRDLGDEDEEAPDGRQVAAALYGGDVSELRGDEDADTDSDEPTLLD